MKFITLLPLLVFVGIFLGSGIVLGDFYALPAPIAVFSGVVVAFLLFYKNGVQENIYRFIKGCGDSNIVMMCLIVLLSGAFQMVTKEMGAVQMVVQITQQYLSPMFLYAGVFVLASFLSFASGTSVGAISTLTPIVAGFVQIEGVNAPLLAASVLSGAMFGDNLSIISDTTIVATQSQGCSMKDKFRVNARIAFPASILSVIVLALVGFYISPNEMLIPQEQSIEWIKILPYILVIVLALLGVNVFVSLFAGIVLAGVIGWANGIFLMDFVKNIYSGFTSMTEVFLVFFFTGGLAYMVEKQGGIEFLISKISKWITSKWKAKLGMASLVALVDAAIANNTVAIMVSAPVCKRISTEFGIKPTHTASIMDIISCIVQGIIPYGAQVLILLKLMNTDIDYLEMISKSYYLWFLFLFSIFYFGFYARKKSYSK